MQNDIHLYLDPCVQNIEELRVFHNIVNKRLNALRANMNKIIQASNIKFTDETTIKWWEQDWDIVGVGELKDRQETILSLMRTQTPFSKPKVINYLNSKCGEDMWELSINNLQTVKTVTVKVDVISVYALYDVIRYFTSVTPADYSAIITVRYKTWHDYRSKNITWLQLINYTWEETVDGVPYVHLVLN